MKISLVVPNISLPTVGAAVRIADMLRTFGSETDIMGADLGHGVCDMYREVQGLRGVSCPRIYRLPDYWWEIRRLQGEINGEIIISFKISPNSLKAALLARRRTGARVIAYLDEWDGAVVRTRGFKDTFIRMLRHWYHPGDDIFYRKLEEHIRYADYVVSTTSLLKSKFGGDVIPFGVDVNEFCPQEEADAEVLKDRWGLAGKIVLGFGGVVRPHKGLEEYLDALSELGDDRFRLVVIGPHNEHVERLLSKPEYCGRIACIGDPPNRETGLNAEVHARMPLYLCMADILIVPLGAGELAASQMPCKLFEAMAMAKPIIASAVSDIPEVLGDGGWAVPRGNPLAIATVVREIIDNPVEAQRRGKIARERCVKYYSKAVCSEKWREVIEELGQ